ncbi:MAG: substrate-binding domain-containing protein [Oscillospiraceae bacterium]|nr:substrate-binding domain-containing protein [Oscillospiraceae bacterium]
MKKILASIIIACTLLTACGKGEGTQTIPEQSEDIMNNTSNTTTNAPETTNPLVTKPQLTEEEIAMIELKDYLIASFENFNIDGSTTMIPLHQSLRDLFGDGRNVRHGKTVTAFEKLIEGEVDILLGVDYSEELIQKAADAGVDLAKIPITREAFVFLLNEENPVKSLTTEQIKDIYSGKITNWAEVGGEDEAINAFQRNSDSGSQMRMVMFMGDIPLIEKGVVYQNDMGGIVEAIANYDKGEYSMAYNMYTFTDKQYIVDGVMLLGVDGVFPTDETIYDSTYPLVTYNYIYYDRNNTQAADFAEKLYAFLMSEEGQSIIADSGYVNLNPGFDRNRNISISRPEEMEDGMGNSVPFHNEDMSEFYYYDVENQSRFVYYSYPDYVLRNSMFFDNENARNFIELIFNSDIDIHSDMLNIRFSGEVKYDKGMIYFELFPWTPVFDITELISFRYEGMYYSNFAYYIVEDKYVLWTYPEDNAFLNTVFENGVPIHFSEYFNNFKLDSSVEFKKEDLINLYVQTWDAGNIEFYQPFKNE